MTTRFVAPQLYAWSMVFRQRLRVGTLLGISLLAVLSAADLAVTIQNALDRIDPQLFWQYLQNTRHGRATLVRYGLLAAVGVLAVRYTASPSVSTLFIGLALALLATFSATSHAASMAGSTPLLADLVHFAAACSWAGPLFYLTLYSGWCGPATPAVPEALTAFRKWVS